MASIRDVAKEAGVSPATVSRAFTTPDLINEETHKRVMEAARLLDYRPPRLRAAARARTAAVRRPVAPPVRDAIGFQFFSATSTAGDTLASNTFYAPVLSGAQAEASALGLHLLVHTTDRHSLAAEMPRMILEQAIGGMLLVGTADPEVLTAFSAHVREIILVDNRDDKEHYESIIPDGFGGAYAATRHLLELGHRKLGFFMTERGVRTFQDRLRGFVCAQFEAGIAANPAWVVQGISAITDQEKRERDTRMIALLRSADRPTAILAANDDHALRMLRACRELGLRVPNDISVIGFDDSPYSSHADPPLTTVHVDKEYMGRLAVRRLAARFQEGGASDQTDRSPICLQIPVTLVQRESCQAL